MAYKVTINKAVVNKAEAMAEIHAQLVAMGWTYVDGMCDEYTIPYTDVSIVNNTFTKIGHTYVDSQPVSIRTTGTLPGELAVNTKYFVVNVSGDTFKLSTTYNGAAIDLSGQGTGNHTIFEYYRIYKSNGEAGDMPYQYIAIIEGLHETQMSFQAGYYFNLTTRALIGVAYYVGLIYTNQTGFYLWIHGDKDKVNITSKVVSTYYRGWFGFAKPFLTLKTTLSEAASSGSNVVLAVADSAGFEIGYTYQIVGMASEGRDNVVVTAIGTGTITVSSLPRNYGIGALIGLCPVCFVSADSTTASNVCAFGSVGLGNPGYSNGSYGATFLGMTSALDPDMRSNKYVLQPFGIDNCYDVSTAFTGIEGYVDNNMLIAPPNGMVIEDTFAVGRLDSGTSSGGNSTTQLNDTTKNWTVNAFAAKVVVLTFGLGSGMIKKISSNDATSLTLSGEWIFESVPDNTSQYIICEEGYRYMAGGTGYGNQHYMALREGI